jgi:hypothetical protein
MKSYDYKVEYRDGKLLLTNDLITSPYRRPAEIRRLIKKWAPLLDKLKDLEKI